MLVLLAVLPLDRLDFAAATRLLVQLAWAVGDCTPALAPLSLKRPGRLVNRLPRRLPWDGFASARPLPNC